MATQEELDQLRKASEESASQARELLDSEVKSVMDVITRISELKPSTTDEETYEKLINIVSKATDNNESIATLKENVKKLGSTAVSLFKEIASTAKSLT